MHGPSRHKPKRRGARQPTRPALVTPPAPATHRQSPSTFSSTAATRSAATSQRSLTRIFSLLMINPRAPRTRSGLVCSAYPNLNRGAGPGPRSRARRPSAAVRQISRRCRRRHLRVLPAPAPSSSSRPGHRCSGHRCSGWRKSCRCQQARMPHCLPQSRTYPRCPCPFPCSWTRTATSSDPRLR